MRMMIAVLIVCLAGCSLPLPVTVGPLNWTVSPSTTVTITFNGVTSVAASNTLDPGIGTYTLDISAPGSLIVLTNNIGTWKSAYNEVSVEATGE